MYFSSAGYRSFYNKTWLQKWTLYLLRVVYGFELNWQDRYQLCVWNYFWLKVLLTGEFCFYCTETDMLCAYVRSVVPHWYTKPLSRLCLPTVRCLLTCKKMHALFFIVFALLPNKLTHNNYWSRGNIAILLRCVTLHVLFFIFYGITSLYTLVSCGGRRGILITLGLPISAVTINWVDIQRSSIIRETCRWNISELFFTFRPHIF